MQGQQSGPLLERTNRPVELSSAAPAANPPEQQVDTIDLCDDDDDMPAAGFGGQDDAAAPAAASTPARALNAAPGHAAAEQATPAPQQLQQDGQHDQAQPMDVDATPLPASTPAAADDAAHAGSEQAATAADKEPHTPAGPAAKPPPSTVKSTASKAADVLLTPDQLRQLLQACRQVSAGDVHC